jgi:hypothetical protein
MFRASSVIQHSDVSRWFKIALLNFLLAATFGALMRFAFVNELKWFNYKSFQNGHVNLALLGWAYQALCAFLIGAFLPSGCSAKKYKILFAINQVIIAAIVVNYLLSLGPIAGHVLTLLFSFCAFVFIFLVTIDTRASAHASSAEFLFLKIALMLLAFSFAGVYTMLTSLLVSGEKKILLYYIGSQFFLHFQYNGWLTFGVFALFVKLARDKKVLLNDTRIKKLAWVMACGVLLTFFLSLYWGNQTKYFLLLIASFGGLLQLSAFIFNWKYLRQLFREVYGKLDSWYRMLILISSICFLLKLIMQIIVVHPQIASLAFTIHNYVIAFIHLVFIGFISMFLFGWAFQKNYITLNAAVRLGIFSLVTGFILVELFLFIQGTMLWMGKGFMDSYYLIIFIATILLPIGLLIIAFKALTKKQIL